MISRLNLNVPFHDKDKAKEAGARWDPIEKVWFFERTSPAGTPMTRLEKQVFGRWEVKTSNKKIVDFVPTKWCPAWPGK